MKHLSLLIVFSSLVGAVFYTIAWWLSAVQARKKRDRTMVLATFFLAALAAPFLALAAVEFVNYQYKWSRELPSIAALLSFLVGAASPTITLQLRDALNTRIGLSVTKIDKPYKKEGDDA